MGTEMTSAKLDWNRLLFRLWLRSTSNGPVMEHVGTLTSWQWRDDTKRPFKNQNNIRVETWKKAGCEPWKIPLSHPIIYIIYIYTYTGLLTGILGILIDLIVQSTSIHNKQPQQRAASGNPGLLENPLMIKTQQTMRDFASHLGPEGFSQ